MVFSDPTRPFRFRVRWHVWRAGFHRRKHRWHILCLWRLTGKDH